MISWGVNFFTSVLIISRDSFHIEIWGYFTLVDNKWNRRNDKNHLVHFSSHLGGRGKIVFKNHFNFNFYFYRLHIPPFGFAFRRHLLLTLHFFGFVHQMKIVKNEIEWHKNRHKHNFIKHCGISLLILCFSHFMCILCWSIIIMPS